MKLFITMLLGVSLAIPNYIQAQSRSTRQERNYERKTTRRQVKTADSTDLGAILKDSSNAESGPVLNDNGNINSTGAVDGSRSSTGRPDADTTAYNVKRKKTVIRTDGASPRRKP